MGDRLFAVVAIILLSPVLAVLALLIKADSKGSVLFKQKRVGFNKNFFMIYKFRTMRTDAPKDIPTHLLQDPAAHITRIGRFLRKTSLDELPQLFNILRGQMSVVGPRPALWNQDDLIAERDRYGANNLRPGLTGWAQINGRDELPIDVKAALDGEYVLRINFLFDCRIVFNTFFNVLSSKGQTEGCNKA